ADVIGVTEMSISPLPLAPPRIAGFGYHDGRVVTCISFGPVKRDRQKAVLIRPGWALAVDDVIGFISVTVPRRGDDKLPRWLTKARASDGRAVGWIDVAGLVAELA